jgi:hypothetical protein
MAVMPKSRRTKRAVDGWDSAAFSSIFLASGFLCSQTESTPAQPPLTQTVRRISHKEIALNPRDEAFEIKIKNVIEMGIDFSAILRLFEGRSKQKVAQKLKNSFGLLKAVDGKDAFEKVHSEFCKWFMKNVYPKKSQSASYGQAAKVFNIAGKVYVYYCHLPDRESATKLLPLLHAALDTKMMENLKKGYPNENIKVKTIQAVNKPEYFALQKLVAKHIEDEFNNLILPVEYEDIMWYRLNR